ncbi:MAG TPA: histidine phosphatase family protein [Ornithinimicrobium sp.]|uniref:SixA phosphatase family protein n=1 Tax=Ornithinimicrobium sp. TaxID=1977084 RepID=UPI002B49876A|nr:histidine phosphatase family protein [Ornithinimicrobium sp.]HKJ12307.1 histidine phosphatase family protein [Ornithinimicrobium sp.]
MSGLRLVLVRHAKTERVGPPGQGDHGRRLTERGVADARAAGRWLLEAGLKPDLVVCSTATRARQTWQAMAGAIGDDRTPGLAEVETWQEPRAYLATTEDLLAVLAEVPDGVRCLALVGHSPGIPDLADLLSDGPRADPEAAAALQDGFPTMTSAVLLASVPAERVGPGTMTLSAVHTGRGER